jgi:hypothetical protein
LLEDPKTRRLGVINLSLQNDALLLKHLDKFYRKENVQWVNLIWWRYYTNIVPHLAREKGTFWWKDILRLNFSFRSIAVCDVAEGNKVSFWEDLIAGSMQATIYPHLAAFAKDHNISFWLLRNAGTLVDHFRIPMTRVAYNELLLLQDFLAQFDHPDQLSNDHWSFIWGAQVYSSSKYYQYQFKDLHLSVLSHYVKNWLW